MKFYIKTKLSENISETPEGYLLCKNVPLTHTGKLIYQKGEHPFDEIDELIVTRSKDELFSEKTMASFVGKSITIEHPEGFVTPETWQELTHGNVLNVRPSQDKIEVDGNPEDAILGDFQITTEKAIKEVKNGLREVSLGYDALWEHTGENFAVHKNIVGNHVALVNNGRAGKDFSIKDSKESILKTQIAKFKKLFGKTLDEAIGEKEKEVAAKDDGAVAKIEAEIAALQAKLAEAKKAKDEAKEEPVVKEESKDDGDKLDKIIGLLEKLIGHEEKEVGDDDNKEVEAKDDDKEEVEEVADDKEEKEDKYEGKDSEAVKCNAEILSPGIALTKDVKKLALESCYKTTDGKKMIDLLIGDKKLSEITENDVIFSAAAQLLKKSRTETFSKVASKASAVDAFPSLKNVGMSADEINQKNENFYKTK